MNTRAVVDMSYVGKTQGKFGEQFTRFFQFLPTFLFSFG